MKSLLAIVMLAITSVYCFPQTDSLIKFIFVPHPRSDDKVNETTLPGLEAIDYSKYDMVLLGGDLTNSVSKNRTAMNYANNLFDLGSPSTLWTMGNHDVVNRSLIKEFTGRPSYYAYYRAGITFFVLDVELDSKSFQSSYISGEQLNMLNKVCDTIAKSKYLIVVHGRLLWMIGDNYLETKLDSVAQSTNQLDTTNFYQVVYPLLQKAKSKKVKVICLGGDKSKINIDYSPEDSITFLTSTMEPTFNDSQNDVLILNFTKNTSNLSWEFVPVNKVDKKPDTIITSLPITQLSNLKVWQGSNTGEVNIQVQSIVDEIGYIKIYSIQGILVNATKISTNETEIIKTGKSGIYIIKLLIDNNIYVQKKFIE